MKFKPILPERKDPLTVLEEDWKDCTRCPLGKRARNHVLYEYYDVKNKPKENRCDVVLIGEGPGLSEDMLGRPFIGKAGRFLRSVIHRANPKGLNIVLTNLVACRPQDHFAASLNREPREEEISACSTRLESIIEIFDPLAIITLGNIPQEAILKNSNMWLNRELYKVWHPSFVERRGGISSAIGNKYLHYFQVMFNEIRKAKENESIHG